MSLCDQDREILDLWARLGMPENSSTRDYALGLLMKLWAAYKELDAALGEVLAVERPKLQACICPAVVAADGAHLVICPAAPAGGEEPSDG